MKKKQSADRELWNLDTTLALLILPRLKRYREICPGHPGVLNNMEEWHAILDKMIRSFEYYAGDDKFTIIANKKKRNALLKKIDLGMKLFAEWYGGLWI